MVKVFLLLVGFVFFSGTALAEDFGYDAYKSTTLASVAAEHGKDPLASYPGSHYYVETLNIKYLVVGTYTGKHRETISPQKVLVSHWAKTLHHEANFGQEVEVQSGEKKYWLLIQSSLFQPFVSELHEGSAVKLYIMLLGRTNLGGVFAINGFEAQ